jgi:hypothetical protein
LEEGRSFFVFIYVASCRPRPTAVIASVIIAMTVSILVTWYTSFQLKLLEKDPYLLRIKESEKDNRHRIGDPCRIYLRK